MSKPVCIHCQGWGCLQCGIIVVPPPPLGEQGDVELHEIDARVAAAVKAEREACAKLVEVFLHNVPAEGGDDLDRLGRYSNGTVWRIAAAIRERSSNG